MRELFRREPFRPANINFASVDIVGWPGLAVVLIIIAIAMEFPETRILFLAGLAAGAMLGSALIFLHRHCA
jgi:hypothetical protein